MRDASAMQPLGTACDGTPFDTDYPDSAIRWAGFRLRER